jgi:hypothetical protein
MTAAEESCCADVARRSSADTAINHLVRMSGLSFTDSAYRQARSRLPLALFHELLRRVAERIRRTSAKAKPCF